ncbi:hypothetical protein BGZ61DRAFT_486359 [Ilyonectria robusta]|uniref:uncharacterized protein n=1 Tax=Ilyonectria robusta TaxID=1079257 RepID=UPI001E8D110D|nr:uncharacterized protein BGZ61DRAFT_486359 [Ilyonectria robusta]KAH8656859.1 hypothetical protein BGZ61DRAFT_486359 [Ilyonectria robusta]
MIENIARGNEKGWKEKIPNGIEISNMFEKQTLMPLKASKSSFSSFQGTPEGSGASPGSSGSSGPRPARSGPSRPLCLCGKWHFYADCYYLISWIRPTGWKAKEDIKIKVNKQLEEPKIKE